MKINRRQSSTNDNNFMFMGFAGPSRFARFEPGPGGGYKGGHTFSPDAAVFGFENFITPEVQKEHSDWLPQQVKREAIIRFNLRLHENMSRGRDEERNTDGMATHWVVEKRNGQRQLVVAEGESKGQTFDELWGHTEQYTNERNIPETYNNEEYKAQKSVVNALLSGEAQGGAYILSDPDSAKYVQTWSQNADGSFFSYNIDFANVAGRHLTHQEGRIFMRKLIDQYKKNAIVEQSESTYQHFLVKDKPVDPKDIQVVARAQVLFVHQSPPTEQEIQRHTHERREVSRKDVAHIERKVINDATETARLTIHAVLRDARATIQDTSAFLHDRKRSQETKDRVLGLPVVREVRSLLSRDGVKEHRSEKPTERLTLEKIREKPVRIVEVIEKRYRQMRGKAALIGVVAETGVAVHAAPWLLSSLARELPAPVRAVEKSMRRHERKELRMRNYELRIKKRKARKDRLKPKLFKTEMAMPLGTTKEQKRQKKRVRVYMEIPTGSRKYTLGEWSRRKDWRRRKKSLEKGVKKFAVARLLTPSGLEKRWGLKKRGIGTKQGDQREGRAVPVGRQELHFVPTKEYRRRLRGMTEKAERALEDKRITKREKKLWVVLAVAATAFVRERKLAVHGEMKANLSRKKDKKQERPISVDRRDRMGFVGVQFALLAYQLLRLDRRKEALQSKKDARKQTKGLEKLSAHEEAPWILLSIIWYLAMLREVGGKQVAGATFQVASKKSKRNITSAHPYQTITNDFDDMPRFGVIFAMSS